MIEVVKYLCEFFFCNFWHFCGLVIVLCCLTDATLLRYHSGNKVKDNKQNRKENE